jgi:hypothetical protein
MDDMSEIAQTRERVSPSNVSTQWQAMWVGAPPKLRASPPRPNRFTTASTILSFAMLGREMLTAGETDHCRRIRRGKPAARGCQRIGIGSNRRRQIRFDGTFVRVRLSGEHETPLQRVERRFRQDRDDTIQKAAQAYTKMMAGKPRFWMVVTMD